MQATEENKLTEHEWGEVARAVREERGMTQRELGKAAGISQPAISFIERGAGSPAMRRKISAVLGIRLDAAG